MEDCQRISEMQADACKALHEEHVGLMVDVLVFDDDMVQGARVRDQQLLSLQDRSQALVRPPNRPCEMIDTPRGP